MPRVLRTAAGSTVTFDNLQVRVDFDWFEEDSACIDCEVDLDMSRATGWETMIWRCEGNPAHDMSCARLYEVKPNS